jgi:chromosome segregation ATPase
MSSRNLRTQSQPRSRPSSQRNGSFEARENVNDNAPPGPPYKNERRAQSSMRYKSVSRDASSQRMRGGDPPRTPSNGHPSRTKSAGRMRGPNNNLSLDTEDPDEVAKQILQLRERRIPAQRDSPLHIRPVLSMNQSKNSQKQASKVPSLQKVPSLHKVPSLQAVGSNISQEEIQAEQRLMKAESKISGLLQELDELQFFQELEEESPAKTPKTPQGPSHGPIPTNIRAVSPARGGRLPPPPPPNKSSNKGGGGGLETYKPLSPRRIAKLDRNSLELECQTLVRKLQILDQEKQSQAGLIEMYEISMQEHDADRKKIKKLESELKKVSLELKRQLQNIQKGKESLVKQYEERIQNNLQKLQRIHEKANSFKIDLDAAKADAEKWKQDSEKRQIEMEDRKKRTEGLKAKHQALEEQLTEARNLNTSLVKKVEKKRSEVTSLKEDLDHAGKVIEESKEERNEMYEGKISALENELAAAKERSASLETECSEINSTMVSKDEALEAAAEKETDQAGLIAQLKKRVQDLERETEVRYEEGKQASRATERKRMQEMVAARANETVESERRIKAMQEQLRHQSDRHHAEIEETGKRNDENLELMREDVKEEIRHLEGDKAAQLESELKVLKRSHEQMKADYTSRLKENQQKARETAVEFQRQDEGSQLELDQMHERLENYADEVSRKEDEIADLKDSLQEVKTKLHNDTLGMRSKYDSEVKKLKHLLDEERISFENAKAAQGEEVAALKSTNADIEKESRGQAEELSQQIDEALQQVAEAQSVAKDYQATKTRLEEMETTLDSTHGELQTERTRNEEVESDIRVQLAKLEGRLRANESNLKAKKAQIQELEKQLAIATTTNSKFGEEKETAIQRLNARLNETTFRLEKEQSSAHEKEAMVIQLREEVATLQDKLKHMSRLEDSMDDMKKKTRGLAHESDHKENELHDLRLKLESLETEKIRKDTELSNLRRDYEDMSGLLEENLHSSAKNDDVGIELKKRERELKETVSVYSNQFSDLEGKLKAEINSLKNSLDMVEDEKIKLSSQMSQLKMKYDMVLEELEEFRMVGDVSKGGVGADAERKDGHVRAFVQRYTRVIADLESKLEEESQYTQEVEDKLSNAREELGDKQKQTQELIQRHTKAAMKLESDLSRSTMEREELKIRLDQTTKDLDQKRKELKNTMARYSDEFANLNSVKKEQEEYREMSESTRSQLERKERQLNEMKQKIPELLAELDSKARERDQYKASSIKYEAEIAKRKEQFNESVAHYNDQIADLESRLDEQSVAQSSTRGKVETVRAEANRKDQTIREMKQAIKELESLLEIANNNKDTSKQKSEAIARELDEKQATTRLLEMEKIELESRVHSLTRSKDELRSKVTELSSSLERKEREVREVTDGYKMYVTELESRLDLDTDAKHSLQSEIDKLKSDLSSAAEVSSEASELREKVHSLEIEVDSNRSKARETDARARETTKRLEERLQAATREREEIDETLRKLTYEKSEVINALEGVINEVQNREDEIESLTEILQRRDEELQHAKIIANKALQSAKDIQKRYKEKDQDRQSDMMEKMDELNDTVDVLTSKNDSLQRKISMLERDLRDRNLECKRLKDQLRQVDGKPLRTTDYTRATDDSPSLSKARDDGSTFTQSTYRSSPSRSFPISGSSSTLRAGNSGIDADGFVEEEEEDFIMGADSFSPSNSTENYHGDPDSEFPGFQTQPFEDSEDHENDSRDGSTIASDMKSRRSIERDALRNYVRQRFANR